MNKALAAQLEGAIESLYKDMNGDDAGTLEQAGEYARTAAGLMRNGRVSEEICTVWEQIGGKLQTYQTQINMSLENLYNAIRKYSLEQIASQQETIEAGNEILELLNGLDQEEQEVKGAKMYSGQTTPVTVQVEP